MRIIQKMILLFSFFFSVTCMAGQTNVPVTSDEHADIPVFRLAFTSDLFSGVSPEDAKLALNLMVERIAMNHLSGYKTEAIIFPDIDSAIQEFKNGNIHLIAFSTINYFESRGKVELIPSFVSSNNGKPEHEFALLVKKGDNTQSLQKLKNKTIIVEKSFIGNTALMWLDTMLLEGGFQESASFFSTIKHVEKSSQAILPVFFGQADACIVLRSAFDIMAELNPQVGKVLQVLHESPPLLLSVSCFKKGCEEKIKKGLIEWDNSSENPVLAKQFSLIFRFEKIIPYEPEYLLNIESLYNRYQAVQKK